MPGVLLITWENGRAVKTYGVNQVENYNMKFTFLCIVIVVSCSVSASGDLEIYSGLNFNLNTEERRSRLQNYEDPDLFAEYKGLPWKGAPFDDFAEIDRKTPPVYDFTFPDRIRQFEEVIDWQKAQLNRHDKHRNVQFENPRLQYELEEIYKQLKDSNKPHNFKNYDLGIPNTQILDDVRIYPQEDDFSFNNDDGDEQENIQKFYEQPSLEDREKMFQENQHLSLNKVRSDIKEDSSSSDQHLNHADTKLTSREQLPVGSFRNVKVADDPTEFAYAPPDPRFYEKVETPLKIDADVKPQATNTFEVDTVKNNIKVASRSDEKPPEYHGDNTQDNSKSANGETASRSGVVDVVAVKPNLSDVDSAGVYIIAVVAGISAAATVGLIAVGIGWYNLQKHVKNASDVEYPAYGVTGPNKDISPSGDRRLAQSAQMYHYQHQKQQIIAMERAPPGDRHGSVSDADSDEENEEGDYTVYECPGLAPTGEMEVKNPLFQDDPTPAQTPAIKANDEAK